VRLDRPPDSLIPPATLFAFIWYFVRQVKWPLLAFLMLEADRAGFNAWSRC